MNDQQAAEATKVHRALAQFRLRGVSGTTFGKVYPLRASTTLGRQEDCQVVVPDDGVSRQHARLEVEGDRVMVKDLNSSNGTFVNGQRIRSGQLNPGDELALDNVRFLLELSGGRIEPAALAPSPRPAPATVERTRTPEPERQETATGGGGSWLWLWIGGGAVLVALVLLLVL